MAAKNTSQNKIETSVRNVPLKLSAGIVMLVMSLAWLLSLMLPSVSALTPLRDSILALSGSGCVFACILLLWGGVLTVASAYHPVSRRGWIVAILIYLFVTATAEIVTALIYYENAAICIVDSKGGFFDKLSKAAEIGVQTNNCGAMTFFIAWPLYSVSRVFGFIVALAISIILIFVFFRTNPVKVFEKISNGLDSHQRKKAEKERERARENPAEARPQQQTAARPAAPAYIPQSAPVYRPAYMNGTPQQVYDYEPEQELPAGGSNAVPAVEAPAPMEDEFWGPGEIAPAMDDMYAQPADQYAARPAVQSVPRQPVRPAAQPTVQPAVQPVKRGGKRNAEPSDSGAVPAPVYSDSPVTGENADDGTFDLYDEEEPAVIPAAEKNAAPGTKRAVKAEAPSGTGSADGRCPAAAAPVVTKPVTVPEPEEEEEDSSPDGWTELVRRRRAQAEKKSAPVRDVLKEEPQQVFTDPVMPITGEKIKLNSQSTDVPASKPSLDGRDKQKADLVQMEMKLNAPYVYPKWDFLSLPAKNQYVDGSIDEKRAQDIVDTLASFHIQSEVKQITHGPAITRFALQIAPGVKVSSVTGAANNIGLTLGTNQIRMETPIQGTNYIGIEVPNASVIPVRLREVLDSPEMNNSHNPLLVALGKDIAGTPILCDLSKMPHLLIAGATGSGKSVCINSIVCSLLYRATPEQVRLIMVDPKQVELQVYNGIPHLLTPVVCDPRKASAALNWVVNEMFERYNKFSAAKVRNLSGFNKLKAGTEEVLPNIVVIIDEMADLMEVCRKDVEESVRRLAALARAAGIYLVLATQRPSVDVITGVIKNNIPSRIAFAVSSNTDSRTIIDAGGAEKLVGKGDMLYKPTGSVSQRVQGCFVTDEEVETIAEFVSRNCGPQYDPNIQEQLDSVNDGEREMPSGDDDEPADEGSSGIDDLLREAIEMAVEDGQTSVSMLQRRLRVGYARAGRLVDEMEKRGIVNKSEGSKPRKTIITREQYLRMLEDEEN